MTNVFDCPVLYHDKTIEQKNLCAVKIPIAVIVGFSNLPIFPLSLFQAPEPLDINRAETYAGQYHAPGTEQGDWTMLTALQIQQVAEYSRQIQGILLQLGELAQKIDWGCYYLSARREHDQRYLHTVGIPCGQTCSVSRQAVDRIRLTIKNFDRWLKC